MITLVWLIIIGSVVYYLYSNRKKSKNNTGEKQESSTSGKTKPKEDDTSSDKVIYENANCKLYLENNHGVLLYKGRRYTFGYEPREPFATISSNTGFYVIIRHGENFDACCRGFFRDPKYCVNTITGRKLNAEQFARLLCTAVNTDRGSSGEIEYYIDELERKTFELDDYRKFRKKQNEKYAHSSEQPVQEIKEFPYPAKKPGECRFPGNNDITNFQEYGEIPVEMEESDFKEWWFFCEDLDKPCWSYVGLDKQNRCILQRRYRHGTKDNYTFEKRFFIIKRNIMASAFALAMMNDSMERTNYFELIEKLDRLVPPTGDPETDGPEILMPPQELLDNPSREEIEKAKQEKERKELSGKTVYEDDKRRLYFADDGHTPELDYGGVTYTLSCHPYEPMLIIRKDGRDIAYLHNAFYPDDEYKGLLRGQLVSTITGHYHNAERFARLITTTIDTGCDRFNDVENIMYEDLVLDKGEDAIEYASYDFRCDRVLYEGVPLLLGHFNCYCRKTGGKGRPEITSVYALGFGYPNPHGDMYEYYLISRVEYEEYGQWQETQEWSSHETAYEWHESYFNGRQVLCNEFSHMEKTYKPFFRISELPKDYWKVDLVPFFFIQYERDSVCAQDDYVNHDITIELPKDATVKDLVDYIRNYHDNNGYAAIPYTGGTAWWEIVAGEDTLAEVCDDGKQVRYFGGGNSLRTIHNTSSIYGKRKI